jgi:peptide/nickel transport system ATP-binding protein
MSTTSIPATSCERPTLVEVEDLRVSFAPTDKRVVDGVSWILRRGECLALVGESGCGKSVTARTLVGLTGYGARVEARRLQLAGTDISQLDARAWRSIRGKRVGFIMQDALGSLDPLRTVGKEVAEPLRVHTSLEKAARLAKVQSLLQSVGIPDPVLRALQHPYQLSGGLRQRALIASAIACGPELLIADEPTTALDASIQAQVLELLESLRTEHNAMLVISHDLAVVARLADRVAVMHKGQIVEQGTTEAILQAPEHPYTKSLLLAAAAVHAVAFSSRPAASTQDASETPRIVLEAEKLSKSFPTQSGKKSAAVSDVSLELRAGETVGIVGESGSGKTTLLRMLLGLEQPDAGCVKLHGKVWTELTAKQQRRERRRIQAIFQDPLSSFDPRYTVEGVVGQALDVRGVDSGRARDERLLELLQLVRLDASHLRRRPIELSGGQRQRVAIARALAMDPEILMCDEPLSALDVSVQARILELFEDLKRRLKISCLFISHDLGVIRRVSDRVLVMRDAVIVEQGSADEIFVNPRHPYTAKLLRAIPRLSHDRGGPQIETSPGHSAVA